MTSVNDIQVAIQSFQSGDINRARELLQHILVSFPDDINANLLSAAIGASDGDYELVLERCNKVLEIDPYNFQATFNGMVAGEKLAKYEDVRRLSQKILSQDPSNIQANLFRCVSLFHLGEVDESIREASDLITGSGCNSDLVDNIINIFGRRHADVLIKILQRASGDCATSSKMISKLMQLSLDSGDLALAEQYLTELESTGQVDADVVGCRVKYLVYTNRKRECISYIETLPEEIRSGQPQIMMDLAECYMSVSEYEKSLSIYRGNIAAGYRVALSLHNIGIIEDRLGHYEESIKSYHAVLEQEPNAFASCYNLAFMYDKRGDKSNALRYISRCISINDSNKSRQGFVEILSTSGVEQFTDDIEKIAIEIISDEITDAQTLSTISWLRLSSTIASLDELLDLALHDDYSGFSDLFAQHAEQILCSDLMQMTIRNLPTTNYRVECFIKLLRRYILLSFEGGVAIGQSLQLCEMMIAISTRCYIDGYAMTISDQESVVIGRLSDSIRDGEEVTYQQFLSLLMYEPLHYLYSLNTDVLQHRDIEGSFARLVKLQLYDNLAEKKIRAEIDSVSEISDRTSLTVQEQYESNPYPVWQYLSVREPELLSSIVQRVADYSDGLSQIPVRPDILVAGCGTGSHAIQTCMRIMHDSLTAIDLSKSSLAFAIRKAREYDFAHIEFKQLDILKVADLDKKFDLIESVGVLHHMEDPLSGFRSLVDILKPDGLMNIGLYSKLGRRYIIKAKTLYDDSTRHISDDEIRHKRVDIMKSSDKELVDNISGYKDFYALHDCRDLIFHENENNYSMSELAKLIDDAGLEFIGFDLWDSRVSERFKEMYPQQGALADLDKWGAFEERYPDTFSSMYIFWCRKK